MTTSLAAKLKFLLLQLGSAALALVASTSFALDLNQKVDFDIPAQDLATALIEFSKQSRLQIIVADDLTGQTTQGISGQYAIKQALSQLLDPAGLHYQVASDAAITVGKNEIQTTAREVKALRLAQAEKDSRSGSIQADASNKGQSLSNRSRGRRDPEGTAQSQQNAIAEEIVVTARKRNESLQDVPISATVINGAAIVDKGILTIQDLTLTLPAVKLAKGSTTNRQFIRGVGSGDNPSFEQSVGTFIDDIYHGRARSSEASLFDIQRVEVLKGPQTTYFGNNAIAGALNIVTRDPDDTLGGNIRTSYTPEFDAYTAEVGVDLPGSDTWGVRLAGQYSRGEGWIDDRGTGEDVPDTRNAAARATMVWRPTESLTAKLKAQYTREKERGGLPIVRSDCPQTAPFAGPTGFCAAAISANAQPFADDFVRNTGPNQRTDLESRDYMASLAFDRDLFAITAVTGYSEYAFGLDTDLDVSPLNLLWVSAPEDYRQFSQELRIVSDDSRPLEYVAGAYYQSSTLDATNLFGYGFATSQIAGNANFQPLLPYTPFGVRNRFEEKNDTASAFGALTWKISEHFRANVAVRYTAVDKDFRQAITVGTASSPNSGAFTPLPASVVALGSTFAAAGGLATVGAIPLSREDDHFSSSLGVQFNATSQLMLYARYDNGFKAGGFNGVDLSGTAAALPFAPETVDAFEVGFKSQLLDNRVSFNVALFRSEYQDLQLAGVVPSASGAYVNRVQNAGGAVSQGVELELNVRATPRLRSNLSITYLDAYYTAYPNATITALQTQQLNQCTAANSSPSTACNALRTQDLKNQRTPFAPEFSGSWGVTYDLPLNEGYTLRFENQLFASDEVFLNFNNDPYVMQGSYVREDFTLALIATSGWELALIGKNLSDETIRTYGAALPTSLGTYVFMTEPPRSTTLQFKYAF